MRQELEMKVGPTAQELQPRLASQIQDESRSQMGKGAEDGAGPHTTGHAILGDPKGRVHGLQSTKYSHRDNLQGLAYGLGTRHRAVGLMQDDKGTKGQRTGLGLLLDMCDRTHYKNGLPGATNKGSGTNTSLFPRGTREPWKAF